jgi:hypothetical protein
MKNMLLTSLAISLTICNLSFANDLEELKFSSPENAEYKIFMRGYFNKAGIASPNNSLFSYNASHAKLVVGIIEDFVYSGRTGDKTFEITYTSSDLRPSIPPIRERKREKINLFFEENSLCPLSFLSLYSGCSKDEKLFLKMIKLQGNQLEYQIILPNCLKR